MHDLIGHSITYRVAIGPRAGQKVFTLQTLPAQPQEGSTKGVAQYAGFSLHAGIGIEAHARTKLERLARYVSRPAVSVERLTLTPQGDMTWAQRLKRVFAIEIECCRRCRGRLKVIATIEAPVLIERILAHLKQQEPAAQPSFSPFAARTAAALPILTCASALSSPA